MSTTSTSAHPHAGFLKLIPAIERHANVVFRGYAYTEREEATAVAVAAAFDGYVRLAAQGKNPERDFASGLVTYAILHAKSGRQVGSRSSTTDALSPLARRKWGFRVESLSAAPVARCAIGSGADHRGMSNPFEERLKDNTQTPVVDQAAFRIDFPAFLSSIGPRDRALAQFLSMGHSAQNGRCPVRADRGARLSIAPRVAGAMAAISRRNRRPAVASDQSRNGSDLKSIRSDLFDDQILRLQSPVFERCAGRLAAAVTRAVGSRGGRAPAFCIRIFESPSCAVLIGAKPSKIRTSASLMHVLERSSCSVALDFTTIHRRPINVSTSSAAYRS